MAEDEYTLAQNVLVNVIRPALKAREFAYISPTARRRTRTWIVSNGACYPRCLLAKLPQTTASHWRTR